jgi:hypothetical protein
MKEKQRARMQKGAAPLLEPGEHVVNGAVNMTMPVYAYMMCAGILALPWIIARSSMAVQTDRNIYVFKTNGMSLKATRVLYKAPLGQAGAQVTGGAMTRCLHVGDQKVYLALNGRIAATAQAMADADGGARGVAAFAAA